MATVTPERAEAGRGLAIAELDRMLREWRHTGSETTDAEGDLVVLRVPDQEASEIVTAVGRLDPSPVSADDPAGRTVVGVRGRTALRRAQADGRLVRRRAGRHLLVAA